MMTHHQWSLEDVSDALSSAEGSVYVEPFRHGTMRLGLYAPRGWDPQGPHDQDEIYVVMKGSGWFINGEQRHQFETGDALFVPAGVEHRFEDFSDDLMIWVVFYGPQGGEATE